MTKNWPEKCRENVGIEFQNAGKIGFLQVVSTKIFKRKNQWQLIHCQ
ncbi:hypothetical protein [Victivallis sp. Marseille-Q1083]|nr:hypothetical protein [Victivallis sp. Marseille-Q1083]